MIQFHHEHISMLMVPAKKKNELTYISVRFGGRLNVFGLLNSQRKYGRIGVVAQAQKQFAFLCLQEKNMEVY